jgi:hypothetical protein
MEYNDDVIQMPLNGMMWMGLNDSNSFSNKAWQFHYRRQSYIGIRVSINLALKNYTQLFLGFYNTAYKGFPQNINFFIGLFLHNDSLPEQKLCYNKQLSKQACKHFV